MYMPNARLLRLEPNATYIPLTRVGVLRWGTQILKFVLGLAHFFCVLRYQHVGIGNAKLWRWGSKGMLRRSHGFLDNLVKGFIKGSITWEIVMFVFSFFVCPLDMTNLSQDSYKH